MRALSDRGLMYTFGHMHISETHLLIGVAALSVLAFAVALTVGIRRWRSK